MVSCAIVSKPDFGSLRWGCVRVGESFTKSMKSCALADAEDISFGVILRARLVVIVRTEALYILLQLV